MNRNSYALIVSQKQIKKFIYREHFYAELQQGEPTFDYVQSHAGNFILKPFKYLFPFSLPIP